MRRTVLILVAFAATRVLGVWATANPDVYPAGSADATFEISNYTVWGNQMQDFGNRPYLDFEVEYPPGSVLLGNLPYWISQEEMRGVTMGMGVVFDALGLAAMWRLARRRRQWWGVVAWIVLLPLLGPITYSRIDTAVAATLAWAFERIDAGRWARSGAWLGLGAAVKITPALVIPSVVLGAPRRWRPLAAAAGVGVLFVVPFAGALPEMFEQVVGYHSDRGVHAESLWGSIALMARVTFGSSVELVSAFGASDIRSRFDDTFKILSNVFALGVLADSALATWTRVRRGDGAHVVLTAGGALVLLTAVGRVFSPQYLIWLVPAVAAGLAIAPRAMRWSAVLFGVAAGLAHFIYPVVFFDYLAVEWWAVSLGLIRNLALLGAGLVAVNAAWRYRPPSREDEDTGSGDLPAPVPAGT